MSDVLFQSQTCAEFYDRYEVHIDVDNKDAKLSLNLKFTSKDEDDFKSDLTLDIAWQNRSKLLTV